MPNGHLFYVMGASGAGKDTLLNYARNQLKNDERFVFAHRYITRPIDVKGENHIALSNEEFSSRLDAGFFSLAWQANSLWYGVGVEIEHWLNNNKRVVVNGSRAYLPVATRRYPQIKPVLIEADKRLLEKRLRDRDRESKLHIEKRLVRADLSTQLTTEDVFTISNNGMVSTAGETFCSYLTEAEVTQ